MGKGRRIATPLILAMLVSVAFGCASAPKRVTAAAPSDIPDLSGVLRLVARNHRRAMGCPTAEHTILTNAHVALSSREFSLEGAYDDLPFFFAWATRDDAAKGYTTGRTQLDRYRDLAVIESETPIPHWYPIAAEAPQIGERLFWVGLDWRDRSRAFAERVFSGRLLRISVGHLVIDRAGSPGSSGSCVLNEQGEVVGIHAVSAEMESGESVGGAVGIWGRK